MRYICTLFDNGYLIKGLALHSSLVKHETSFRLFILCMDKECYNTLNKLELKNTTVIPLDKIEHEDLLKAKAERNAGEYSWTCKSQFISYLFKQVPDIKTMVYFDADCFLFDNLDSLYEEAENSDVLITPQWFPAGKEYHSEDKGAYNAGCIVFQNNTNGNKVLDRWKQQCLDWCYHRLENGKLGDQMYLNAWPQEYANVVVSKNIGLNAAPWNIGQRRVELADGLVKIDGRILLMYHFHGFKIYSPHKYAYTDYDISADTKKIIYNAYVNSIKKIFNDLKINHPNIYLKLDKKSSFWQILLNRLK